MSLYPIHFTKFKVHKRDQDGTHHFTLTLKGGKIKGHTVIEDAPSKKSFTAVVELPRKDQPCTIFLKPDRTGSIM